MAVASNTRAPNNEIARTLRRPQFWFALIWIVPTVAWYAYFSLGPVIKAFPISVVIYNIVEPAKSPFVGLRNFQGLFEDPLFWTGVRNTLAWAALMLLMMLPTAMVISLILTNLRKGRNLYQALAFIPVVVSLVAVSLLFRMILDPSVGILNATLRSLHLPTSKFLTDSSTALVTTAFIGAWKGVGFYIVILTAGLLSIPEEMYDAAKVDGANEWQRFWNVTIPLLANTLLLTSVLLMIGALQEFSLPFVMTSGGPSNATYLYNLMIYTTAFTQMRFGVATAAALIQFVVIMLVSIAQIKLLRPKWSY